MGFETSPLFVGIDYFRFAAQAVGMMGFVYLWGRLFLLTIPGRDQRPLRYQLIMIGGMFVIAGAGALLIFVLGWAAATMGWIETGNKASLDGFEVFACLLEIGMGAFMIGLPSLNAKFGNWLDRLH